MGVKGKLLYWIGDYLHGRKAKVWYQGSISHERSFELGTPQGGVLSPTLLNVLINQLATEKYGNGVTSTIYADDVLLQGKDMSKMQVALEKFVSLCQKTGLVINENKTKFISRGRKAVSFKINGKSIENVAYYKYLGMYIGYSHESKDAELNYLLAQCRRRLQPMKALAYSGRGVGIPILRMMYITTVRSLIDYAAPVISTFGEGRMSKLEKLQNEAMRIILGCPMTVKIEVMKMELNLQSIMNRVSEVNTVLAVRLIRGEGGIELLNTIRNVVNYDKQLKCGKLAYVNVLAGNIKKYNLIDECMYIERKQSVPPWDEHQVTIEYGTISMKKSMYLPYVLKNMYIALINDVPKVDMLHVYCDGSVSKEGKAGSGVLIREYVDNVTMDREIAMRLSDNVSSTQAGLLAIRIRLREIVLDGKNPCFFIFY